MSKKFLLVGIILFCLYAQRSHAQAKQDSSIVHVATADSLASGNLKSVITSFYNIAITDLTGPNKQLNFNLNVFGVLLKTNPNFAIDKEYKKYTPLRRLNIGFSLNLDSSYRFNGFSSTLKYAIIDKRDSTISWALTYHTIRNDSEYIKLNHLLVGYAIDNYKNQPDLKKTFIKNVDLLLNADSIPFYRLDTSFQHVVRSIVRDNHMDTLQRLIQNDSTVILHNVEYSNFQKLKNALQNKHILTLNASDTTYSDGFFFKSVRFYAESIRGFLHPDNAVNIEWDGTLSYIFGDDTLQAARNLKRQYLSVEPGFNLVIKNKASQKSYCEFKLSGAFDHYFSGTYALEKKDQVTLNGILRIRITNDLWIPFLIKYDLTNHNVFGFLNVTTNFSGLGNILKEATSKK